jgi:hypothetical protein
MAMRGRQRPSVWKQRLAGGAWLAIWCVVLYGVASPWRRLGGVVDERLRWLEWFVLMSGLAIGFTIGRAGRDAAQAGWGGTHARFLRFLLYPIAALTAISLVVLTLIDQRGPIGVVSSGFLAYWAGLDLAFGAVPLMEGKSYRFERPLDPDPIAGGAADSAANEWVPPWERF